MTTETEELQTKEFLKRAEIRTMKKDLQKLREADSLKERYKIVNIKTLEEQQAEHEKQLKAKETASAAIEKGRREEVLQKNEGQERIAEKDLKEYATEQERQQIFLLESQRLGFEKQAEEIDNKKDPALKLEKNKILLEKRNWEAKLNSVKEEVKKLDTEENFLIEKTEQSKIPSERKGLEERRREIENQRKEIEKRTWEAEKQLEAIEKKIKDTDDLSEKLVAEKNSLNQKVLGADKLLREIYSAVMAREEEKRMGNTRAQVQAREALAKTRAEEKESVQRQQWTGKLPEKNQKPNNAPIPVPMKARLAKTFQAEEEQRKKFLQDVEQGTNK
jgi:hypothetical protein